MALQSVGIVGAGAWGTAQGSGKLISQVVDEVSPGSQIAVLSGPSFAAEVARGLPAAVTLATAEEPLGRALSYALSHPPFRCYWSDDVMGAEIGGARHRHADRASGACGDLGACDRR